MWRKPIKELLSKKNITITAIVSKTSSGVISYRWTFHSIIFADMVLSWAVEAMIAWEAAKDPDEIHYMTA